MNLEQIGWNSFFANQNRSGVPGRVALARREHFVVWTEAGEVQATISGHLRHNESDWPGVGDWVILRDGSVVSEVFSRRTKLSRKRPGNEAGEQILAANIDVLFVVTGLDNDYNPRRLERYLVLAYESGARPIVLLNKADLHLQVAAFIQQTERCCPGVPVSALSALQHQGLESLTTFLAPGETAALIGSSGAGKSTIVNALLSTSRQRVSEVRAGDSKGRHTTTQRELVMMPEGWLLIDLPGLRELQLWADPERIDDAFAEIAELARHCRFRDCSHNQEPGCAVRSANLDPGRLTSYHKLTRELAFLERQGDPNAARAAKRWVKSIEKNIRTHPKRN